MLAIASHAGDSLYYDSHHRPSAPFGRPAHPSLKIGGFDVPVRHKPALPPGAIHPLSQINAASDIGFFYIFYHEHTDASRERPLFVPQRPRSVNILSKQTKGPFTGHYFCRHQ